MRIYTFTFLHFQNRAILKFTLFVYLPVHTIVCLFLPDFTVWDT
jgi:hypothetical protein